jgi:hypothetical protein
MSYARKELRAGGRRRSKPRLRRKLKPAVMRFLRHEEIYPDALID